MKRQIAELDAEIAALIDAREATARNRDILCSMSGVGAVTAAAMLTLLPEIRALERKKVASLAGLAPITRQSGQWQGKSFIGGGRKPLRDALYMPALVECDAIWISRSNTKNSGAPESPPRSPSLQSCASLSKWRMLSSRRVACGHPKGLINTDTQSLQAAARLEGALEKHRAPENDAPVDPLAQAE